MPAPMYSQGSTPWSGKYQGREGRSYQASSSSVWGSISSSWKPRPLL
jgi:hypothetical protein